ncbi:MAG: transglutaminase-like domain-containing protein [Myxococcota bacterium]
MGSSKLHELLADSAASFEDAALVVARDIDPQADLAAARATLAGLAEGLPPSLAGQAPAIQAEALSDRLAVERGYRGNEDDYYDPRNSDLTWVLTHKKGLPITLGVIYVAVAERAGLRAEGIGFPGHFLVRIGGVDGAYQDPFHDGRVLSERDLGTLAEHFLGGRAQLRAGHLRAVSPRELALRMLANLQTAWATRGDGARAMVAADRLVDLNGAPEHYRDRGLLALSEGAHAAAAEDFRHYLEARPAAEDALDVRAALAAAERHGATLN